ncbi:hypothetical protein [Microvirga sp. VF16]|uniref:hypothetical protein n=1 Tax=Microvirga sp. VF16 TaxID=2807101 RepID=UPI00193CCC85|nr:hypothetical protein [Microvirga sp. VF16]QRM32419.1 hypothetical protein JO965_30405 [Microvirga sp. VF16]
MSRDEIEVVAAELARAGGIPWFPGRERGPLTPIAGRYRERTRMAIEALDRHRALMPGKACGRNVESLLAERQQSSGVRLVLRSRLGLKARSYVVLTR